MKRNLRAQGSPAVPQWSLHALLLLGERSWWCPKLAREPGRGTGKEKGKGHSQGILLLRAGLEEGELHGDLGTCRASLGPAMGTWEPVLPSPPVYAHMDGAASSAQPFSLLPQAKESIEQLVYLCQTDKEPVREAAKQSLMLCGECPAAPLLPPRSQLPPCPQGAPPSPTLPAGEGDLRWSLPTPCSGSWCPKLCGARAGWRWAARARSLAAAVLSVVVIYYLLDGTERTI